eukprot:gene7886-780_t
MTSTSAGRRCRRTSTAPSAGAGRGRRAAFKKGDRAATAAAGAELLAIIDDYDRLLSSDANFMLGRWTAWARGWGATDDEGGRGFPK